MIKAIRVLRINSKWLPEPVESNQIKIITDCVAVTEEVRDEHSERHNHNYVPLSTYKQLDVRGGGLAWRQLADCQWLVVG